MEKISQLAACFLLVLQIPVNVFAEGWISETDISADNDFAETENAAMLKRKKTPILSMMRK